MVGRELLATVCIRQMLKLKPKADAETPPDKFTYRFVQDGYVSEAFDKTSWFNDIHKHYVDNSYPIPEDWKEQAEDQLCRHLSGEWCDGGTSASFINTRFTFNDFLRGSQVLGSFALDPDGTVDQATAEQRALICSRCVANVTVPGCSTCNAMANLVTQLKGSKQTSVDHLLKACGVCHCSNEAQVWVKAEHLKKGVTPEMMETYKTIPECWKYRELSALDH